jgi:hypothetical protein
MKLRKLGGIAAIVGTCMYILYRVLLTGIVLTHFGTSDEPAKLIAGLATASTDFYVLNLLYIIIFILAVVYVYAFYERLKDNAPHLSRSMLITAFLGTASMIAFSMMNIKELSMIVPVKDASAFLAVQAVASGMNSLGDHAWGWAYLLLGCAVLKTRAFSRIPGWLAILTGIMWISLIFVSQFSNGLVGLFSMVPYIISTIWLGIALLRQEQPQSALKEMAVLK